MSASLNASPAPRALLALARDHSSGEELKCHALLELLETSHRLNDILRHELTKGELTESGFLLLAGIIKKEPLASTPGELASELNLARPTVSVVLGRLEISGLITRQRSTDNRRQVEIRATPAGRQLFTRSLQHYLKSINGIMSAIPTKDISFLDQACGRLRRLSSQFSQ